MSSKDFPYGYSNYYGFDEADFKDWKRYDGHTYPVYDFGGRVPLDHMRGATFTVTLGSLVANGFDVGLKAYPIFDEDYREGLNAKIVEHFWFREIGQETPAMFKRFLNRRMNEIMPIYNQYYKSTLLEFDPLRNYDLWSTGDRTGKSGETATRDHNENQTAHATADSTSKSDTKSRALVSQTPQMQLSGRDDYATNITDTNTSNTASSDSSNDSRANTTAKTVSDLAAHSVDEYTNHVIGLNGIVTSDALQKWRATFLNIDMDVIHELEDLFMGIYTDYWNAF